MTTMDASLQGKRTLITGASHGIGRSIAFSLARAGAKVAISARTSETLQVVEQAIKNQGGESLAVVCDVTEKAQVKRMTMALNDEWGGIDILVNNAGMAGSHKFITHPDGLWHRIIDTNLTGVYHVTKAFAGGMLQRRWGRIINIASTAAKKGGKYIAAYSAAKHGVLGLTRSLALELAPHVTVNAICPGYVDTPMTKRTIENIVEHTGMSPEDARKALAGMNPQGRLLSPNEVAAFAVAILGDGEMTGQALDLDGEAWV